MFPLNVKLYSSASVSMDPETSDIFHSLLPDLKIEKVDYIPVGWNSKVYIVNDTFTVKIPKTMEAEMGIEKEIEISEAIRNSLPVNVPLYVSSTSVNGTRAFAYKYIRGAMMTTRPLGGGVKRFDPTTVNESDKYHSIQKQLAEILSVIHGLELDKTREIIYRYNHKTWATTYAELGEKFRSILDEVFHGDALISARTILRDIIEKITHFSFQEKFIHGDFGGWNIIYDEEHFQIKGILDWADSNIGDPAIDFAELIYDYGEKYAFEVFQLYNNISDSQLMRRASIYLRLEGFRDILYGVTTGSSEFLEKGRKNIEKMVSEFNH